MTTESPKKKRTVNTNGPLDEFDAAKRIVRIISETNPLTLEQEVRAAVEKRRAERKVAANEQIAKLLARVPEGRRGHVARHVIAAGFELSGFEISAANDPTPSAAGAGDEEPEEMPAGAREMTPERAERVARLTGPGRAR